MVDNRNIPDLIVELALMQVHPKEHPIDFLNTLEEKKSTVITRYRLDGVFGDLLKYLMQQLSANLVGTLVHGVHPTLGSHLQVIINELEETKGEIDS